MIRAYTGRWERIITRAVATGKARAKEKLKRRYKRERAKAKQKRAVKPEEPKTRAYAVHIKTRYDRRKDHEIDYEAYIVVEAGNEDEAEEKALDELVRRLETEGYPVVWNRIEIGVERADLDEVGESEIYCRGKPI